MAKTSTASQRISVRPINRFDRFDSPPRVAFDLNKVSGAELRKRFGLSKSAVNRLIAVRRRAYIPDAGALAGLAGISRKDQERLRRCGLGSEDERQSIIDVQPARGRLLSGKPFSLRVEFLNPSRRPACLVSVRTLWQGRPFVVEKRLTSRESSAGYVNVRFHEGQTLPPGPARFLVDLFDQAGGQSTFQVTCVVLPSNPLSLALSPSTQFVTGTNSARGFYQSSTDEYKTVIRLSAYNGNASAVTMSRNVVWEFWDGGVGGSLKESGTHVWSSGITVPAFGTWAGVLTWTSPRGSGIYTTYDKKEDMTVNIRMTSSGGTAISATITARVMVAFGVDVIRVAADTFVGQEYTDLYDAAGVMQEIYEARDVTLRGVGRFHIHDADAGGYRIMNSESECRDLFEDWSAASGGDFLDLFVAHDFVGTGFDGLAGDIPGPTSHSGRKSAVVCDKTGYVDGSGTRRLSVEYLGMLMAHELGHYLGLSHAGTSGNLMLSNSATYDTDLTYDQYRDILGHGWVFVD